MVLCVSVKYGIGIHYLVLCIVGSTCLVDHQVCCVFRPRNIWTGFVDLYNDMYNCVYRTGCCANTEEIYYCIKPFKTECIKLYFLTQKVFAHDW